METLNLKNETWRFPETPVLNSSKIQLNPGQDLHSIEREAIHEYYETFGCKEFMLFQAQSLPSSITENAYVKEEDAFKKTFQCLQIDEVPHGSSIITSHVLYKVKTCDDGKRFCKDELPRTETKIATNTH